MTLRVRFGSGYCMVLRHRGITKYGLRRVLERVEKQIRQHKREGRRFMSEVGGKEDRIRLV